MIVHKANSGSLAYLTCNIILSSAVQTSIIVKNKKKLHGTMCAECFRVVRECKHALKVNIPEAIPQPRNWNFSRRTYKLPLPFSTKNNYNFLGGLSVVDCVWRLPLPQGYRLVYCWLIRVS